MSIQKLTSIPQLLFLKIRLGKWIRCYWKIIINSTVSKVECNTILLAYSVLQSYKIISGLSEHLNSHWKLELTGNLVIGWNTYQPYGKETTKGTAVWQNCRFQKHPSKLEQKPLEHLSPKECWLVS